MIPRQSVGFTLVALACGFVFWRGRRPERLGISLVAAGWLLTPLVEQRESWYRPQFGIMAVDIVILTAFVVMAFRYDRYWTICAAAFQAIAVMVHFAFLIDPRALYRAYYFETFAIGYLVLGSILGGVIIESPAPYRRRRPSSPAPPSDP
jgi:hypothetical protein